MSFSERTLVAKVECVVVDCGLVGGDVLNFNDSFVAVVVGGSKLEVVAVVRMVWSCVSGEQYF